MYAVFVSIIVAWIVPAAEPALSGYCPVCLVGMEKFVPGSDKYNIYIRIGNTYKYSISTKR
jgi:hypothetical protein